MNSPLVRGWLAGTSMLVVSLCLVLFTPEIARGTGEAPLAWIMVGLLVLSGFIAFLRALQLAGAGKSYGILFVLTSVYAFMLAMILAAALPGPVQWMTSSITNHPLELRPVDSALGAIVGVVLSANALSFYRWEYLGRKM